MVRLRLLLLSVLVLVVSAHAQPPVELHQAAMDLANDFVVMDLSAHPDDEDGSTLAYYRMGLGARTYSVLFTRGEGGQNEKGSELYEDLGVLRSQETREAGQILGTEVYFLNFLDFGFSKTATEAFQKWGGQRETLRRLVYMIRKLKPDVIFTNHNTIDGHGHHQAVAITAIAAFDAAADSSWFPEQLKMSGISLWQPKKLYFRAFGRAEPTADVANAIDSRDSLRETGYIDIASQALKRHRTQGMERADLRRFTRGKSLYKLMRSSSLFDADSTSFFGGIDLFRDPVARQLLPLRLELTRWNINADLPSFLRSASRFMTQIDSVENVLPASPLARRIAEHWQATIERLAALRCGIRVSIRLEDSVVVANQQVRCLTDVQCSGCTLSDLQYRFDVPKGWTVNSMVLTVPAAPVLTLPRRVAQYRPIEDEQQILARISYRLDGIPLRTTVRVPFDVAPRRELAVIPNKRIARLSHVPSQMTFRYVVTSHMPGPDQGAVRLELPAGWHSIDEKYSVRKQDDTATGTFNVRLPARLTEREYTLLAKTDGAVAPVSVSAFDVAMAPGIRLGIIASYDTTIESAAHDLGLEHTLIDDSTIVRGDLSRYTTILIDIRAYLVRHELASNNARLLEYVRDGGNLVVMYQREQEWKPEYAPYPFNISRRRVTVEEAPVSILLPQHSLLNKPNLIGPRDWDGWKQERGVYFPGDVPPQYQRLLSTGDPDEESLDTGYLVAPYGKGSYIYTSLVWYRQLKEKHVGAFRCFANMISYPAYRQ